MALLFGQTAQADADYPVYACEGPFLNMVSPGGLTMEEVRAQFPQLPAPKRLEFYILQDGATAAWTDLNRDALREMCLARHDRANAPLSGDWTLRIAPFDPGNCTAPPPIEQAIGLFPRQLTFGDGFEPVDILQTGVIDWNLSRYPEDDLKWSAYAGQREGVEDWRALAAGFLQVSPNLIEIDFYAARTQRCHDNYTLFLERAEN